MDQIAYGRRKGQRPIGDEVNKLGRFNAEIHMRTSVSDLAELVVRIHSPPAGFWQIEAHFGFAQTPNVPRELGRADIPGLELDPSQLSFFVGRANVKSSSRPGMARWRERLYSGLARIATRSTDFFRIPPDRVIELGAEVEI